MSPRNSDGSRSTRCQSGSRIHAYSSTRSRPCCTIVTGSRRATGGDGAADPSSSTVYNVRSVAMLSITRLTSPYSIASSAPSQ